MNCNYEDLEPIIGAALKKAKVANERIDALPLPMVFKGTLGTGGTISTLPTASSENEGYVYIVITDGTYAGQAAKAGDTFVSDGSSWVLVPSADEPSVIDDSVTSTALTWSSKKISDECKVKSFTYKGAGQFHHEHDIPDDLHIIIGISNISSDGTTQANLASPLFRDISIGSVVQVTSNSGAGFTNFSTRVSWTDTKIIFDTNNTTASCFNLSDVDYTVYYI